MVSEPPGNTDIGAVLRARREALGLSLEDVQAATHIRTGYLEALEQNRWDHLPAEVYALGFLRTYARHLGLDAEDLVRAWRAARQAAAPAPAAEPPRAPEPPAAVRVPRRSRPAAARTGAPRPWAWGAVVVVLLAVLVGVVAALRGHRAPTPPRVASGTPSAPRPAAPRPASAPPRSSGPVVRRVDDTPQLLAYQVTPGPVRLTLTFSAPCWVEVWVDGVTDNPAGHTYGPGDSLNLTGRSLRLLLGNPGGAAAVLNGRTLGVLGSPGQPRYLNLVAGG
ncbi:MAG: helix-turn-helix domain-containing protein [Actinomycetia bacterium]|nr:helix-turn-helix domain-containing protein [Actinomycetes bacterium]